MKNVTDSADWEGHCEEVAIKTGPGDRNQEYNSMEFKLVDTDKNSRGRQWQKGQNSVTSVVDGHTNYLTSFFIWVKKRREMLKNTKTRDMTNGRQGKNVTEVTATKERDGTTRKISERRIEQKS